MLVRGRDLRHHDAHYKAFAPKLMVEKRNENMRFAHFFEHNTELTEYMCFFVVAVLAAVKGVEDERRKTI